jgi:hypothetical protein
LVCGALTRDDSHNHCRDRPEAVKPPCRGVNRDRPNDARGRNHLSEDDNAPACAPASPVAGQARDETNTERHQPRGDRYQRLTIS